MATLRQTLIDGFNINTVQGSDNVDFGGQISLSGNGRVQIVEWINIAGFEEPGTKSATLVDRGLGQEWEFSDATDDTITATRTVHRTMDRNMGSELKIGWSSPTLDPGDNTKQAVWQLEYLFLAEGDDTAGLPQGTLTITDTASSVVSGGLVISTIPGIVAASIDDVAIKIRIKRLGADPADTIGGVCHLLGVGIEYIVDKLGKAIPII